MKKVLTILAVFLAALAAQAQKKDSLAKADTLYFIKGTNQEFALLYTAIVSPDDVTVNQRKYLVEWLRNRGMLPPLKEADKPKEEKPKN